MDGNYIKINRSILEWGWYGNINTCRLFIHMLLKANWKDGEFEGKVIPRGSFVSSIPKLSSETELTQREIRTAIDHLKTTGELTVKTTNKYSVFTVNNYCFYQSNDMQSDSQATGNRHSIDSLTTTIEERKNKRKEENNNIVHEAQELFERLWRLYPNKKGKGQVSDAQKKKLLKIGEPAMVKAIERYKTELQKDADWRKPQNGSTFFNSGYEDYLDQNYEPGTVAVKVKPTGFTNFEQRDYDFEELEKQLLDMQKGDGT